MPNWCSNRMYFSAEPAQITEIKRLASGAVTPFYRRATNEESTKNLKSGTLQALQNEIEQRLKPHYPEIWLRIDQGNAPSVSVTGARNDKDKERIRSQR